MNTKNNGIAVGYCRVSTDEQANQGLSMEVQEEALINGIKNDGYTLLKVIRDDGISAGSLKRPGIQEIIGLVLNKKIQAIYAISSDRLNRNAADYLYLKKIFQENGVKLRYVYQQNLDDSAVSITMDNIMASFNEMQRLITSEKVKKTLNAKAEAGYFPSLAPLGYNNIKNPDSTTSRLANKIIVPNEMAPFITEAFKLYATGNYNGYDLNEIMFKKGLRSKLGTKLPDSRFYELLKNRIYLGELHWGKINIEKAQHQPLIDKETFNHVQSIMAGHNYHACRRRKYKWLLNGFLLCAKNGRRYTAEWHLDKGIAYYHCSSKHGCSKHIEMTKMEDMVAEKFKDIEFNEDFIELIINKAKNIFYNRRKAYEGKKQGLINQKTALEAKRKIAEDKLLEKVISNEDFSRLRQTISIELNNISDRLIELENKHDVRVDVVQEILRFTKDIYLTYTKAPYEIKRHYLNLFWENFQVDNGVIIKSVSSLLFRELLRLQQISLRTKNPQIDGDLRTFNEVIITNEMLRR